MGSFVHPPLGKWTIALGIKAFGMDPFGWRIGSAIAGTLAVTGVALIAQLLFGRALWTFVAGLLLALEHLSVVLSRQALLDIHLQLWIVAGFLCLVLDRRWIDRRTPRGPPAGPARRGRGSLDVPSPLWRPWRYAAGIGFGAAVPSSGRAGLGMLAAIVISLMWETSRRRRGDVTRGGAFARALAAGELRPRHRLRAHPVGRLRGDLPPMAPPLRLERRRVLRPADPGRQVPPVRTRRPRWTRTPARSRRRTTATRDPGRGCG